MSFKAVKILDHKSWNTFVAGQGRSSIYQSYEWGQIQQRQGWESHYVAVTNDVAWQAAALVLVKRLPVGAVLYSPCGPIVAGAPRESLAALVEAVCDIAKNSNGMFWRIEPRILAADKDAGSEIKQAGFQRVPQEWSFWNRPKYDMHLNLMQGETKLFDSLGRKNRWKIRSALKQVHIHSGTSEKDIEAFYGLLKHTAAKKHILVRGIEHYNKCLEMFSPSMIRIFVASQGERAVAAGISTRYGTTATLLHMSNDYSVANMGWAIQWEMIRWAIAEGCHIYDFAGTGTNYPPRETDEGYGVYEFKRSFGSEIVAWYGYADYVFRPASYRVFRGIEQSLPYGKRLFWDWPRAVLHRVRTGIGKKTKVVVKEDAPSEK